MGSGRELHVAHEKLVAFVKSIAGASYYTKLTGVYGQLILPEQEEAVPPYACVEIDEDSVRTDQDNDTSMSLVLVDRIYVFVPETSSKPAKESTIPKQLLQATQDIIKAMLTKASTFNTLDGTVGYVKPGNPQPIPAYGTNYGELQFPIELGLDLTLEGLGP